MRPRRVLAVLLAIVAIGVLLSVPYAVAEHLRETARTALGGVANGTVVALETKRGVTTVLVEFHAGSSSELHQLRAPAEMIGFLFPRPRLQTGDPVLVAYDPNDPSRAHLFSIRTLWKSIVGRGFVSVLLAVAAVLLFFKPRPVR